MAEPTGPWGLKKTGPGVATVARAEYRVTLALGEIDALCSPKADKVGQQQRLALIGAFMEPLDSKSVAARFKVALKHFAKQVSTPPPKDAALEDALVAAVASEVVVLDGAAAGTASQLPQAGQFAQIRLAAGFAINSLDPLWFPVPHAHRFNAEQRYFDANPLLGALPIVARVEQRMTAADAWSAAPAGIQVHFQLVVPDALPAGNMATAEPPRAETRVKNGKGPKGYLEDEFAANAEQAGDPQVDNCVVDRGGKRKPGAGSATDYFETTSRTGFGSDRTDPFPVAAASSHALAVVAATNDKGEAGVIFRPSRQGGDRYKLRAFLDPVGPGGAASDGTDAKAVRAESGTLVVWRTLRVSGYHQFDYPAGTPAATKTANGGALGVIDFTAIAKAFSRAYVLLIVESAAKRQRHLIGDAFWVKVIEFCRTNTREQPSGVSQKYDLKALFPNANATVGLIRMELQVAYDAARQAGYSAAPAAAATLGTDWSTLMDAFMETFMRYFTSNATPGLVIVQAPVGDSITAAGAGSLTTSGVAQLCRGCYLFYGSQTYAAGMPYNLDSNTLHEMGHCLFLPHQWTDRNAANGAVSGGVPPEHDYHDYCIMSYQRNVKNFYDYCGRCNLKLRGWDTSKIAKNNT